MSLGGVSAREEFSPQLAGFMPTTHPLFRPVDNCPIHRDFHGSSVVTLLSLWQGESMVNLYESVANLQLRKLVFSLILLAIKVLFLVKKVVRGTGFEPVTPTVSR